MEFRATRFPEFSALPVNVRDLLGDWFATSSEGDPAESWRGLAADHDDQAAAMLAVFAALSRTFISPGSGEVPAAALVERLHLLAGDRVYATLSRATFDKWRASGRFRIRLNDVEVEEGTVRFNRGQLGASLHRGFDIQGVTAINRIPRIQWNYRLCDGLADIDLDGFSPFNPLQHLTYANSDPRQWFDRYQNKFGDPGFSVERIGNVPELRVEDTSVCRNPRGQLTSAEQASALSAASTVTAAVAATNDFRVVAEQIRGDLEPILRDSDASPLQAEVSDAVRESAAEEDLFGYYASRVELERSARLRGTPPAAAALAAAPQPDPEPIETTEELRARRLALEAAAAAVRSSMLASDARADRGPFTAPMRAWVSVADRPAYGYPAGTRFAAVETETLQLLFGPDGNGHRLLFAVPRTKY